MTMTAALLEVLEGLQPGPVPVLRGGRVTAFDGMVVEVAGLQARLGDGVRVGRERRDGEVIGFRDGRVVVMGLAPLGAVAPGDPVLPAGKRAEAVVGPGVLGRVIDGLGQPLDGLGPVLGERRAIDGPALSPLDRAGVLVPLETGVRVLDALLTPGRGGRMGIMAGTGVGKSVLLGQIVRGAAADVVVVALIGERGREITDFVDRELTGPARRRTLVVAVAEHFRDQGKHVLLVMDSLSRVAQGARDVALARGEAMGRGGWPASALALVARLCERAGAARGSEARVGGAISAVVTVLAEGDALAGPGTDPVVDAARGVLDGHVVLSRRLAGRGVFPAVDLAASASRVMMDVVAPGHAAASLRFRRMLSLADEHRDLVMMGAHAPGADPEVDAALALAPALEAFVRQGRDERAPMAESVAALERLVAA
jgi:flagellum-specific ATP synthase